MSFSRLYRKQIEYQKQINNCELPIDDIEGYKCHVLGLMQELGEVLKADERYANKPYRELRFDKKQKKEELADCFIELMNMVIYSGINSIDMEMAIYDKIIENENRIGRH